MGILTIACYKPKNGKKNKLHRMIRKHLPILREQGLVTDRESTIMEAKDGTVVEVFEWKSKSAIKNSHKNYAVLEMWGEFSEACDYIPLKDVPEASDLFSIYMPLKILMPMKMLTVNKVGS
jgi:hypothetical protein